MAAAAQSQADEERFSFQPASLPQCLFCRHKIQSPYAACSAFPGGIPDEIQGNQFDHRKPWIDPATGEPGDQGIPLEGSILFAFKPDIPPDVREAITRKLDTIP